MQNNNILDIGAVFLFIFFVIILICIISFLINAIAIFLLGKRHNVKNYGFAFLPFGQDYVLLHIPKDEFNLFDYYKTERNGIFGKYLLFLLSYSIITGIMGLIPCVSFFVFIPYIVYIVVYCQIKYDIYKLYFSDTTSEVLSIIGVFFPIVYTISYYVCLAHKPLEKEIINIENENMSDIINSYENTNINLDLEKQYDINNDNDKKYDL